MSQSTKVSELLAAALQGAADVARARLGRDVQVGEGLAPDSSAILRFDLPFTAGGRLTWFISNEDATGLSDLLIGGSGDRGAVLTEMHLDALTVAFSDMLSKAVDGIAGGISEPLESGEIDLGMEAELPAPDPAGTRVVLALHVDGWGMIPVVQQADADLTHWLDMYALASVNAPAAAAPAPAAAAAPTAESLANAILADEVPAPAGPAPAFAQAAPHAGADNVVPLAAVDEVVVRQVLAIRAVGKRYVSPAIGTSFFRTIRPRTGRDGQVELTYPEYVRDRILHLADGARRRSGDADPPPVRRQWAWPEIAGLAVTGLGFLVTVAL